MEYTVESDIGLKRSINEDRLAFFKRPDGLALALVADGMGGHNAGDVASDMAIQQMESFFYRQTHIILYPQHQKKNGYYKQFNN